MKEKLLPIDVGTLPILRTSLFHGGCGDGHIHAFLRADWPLGFEKLNALKNVTVVLSSIN